MVLPISVGVEVAFSHLGQIMFYRCLETICLTQFHLQLNLTCIISMQAACNRKKNWVILPVFVHIRSKVLGRGGLSLSRGTGGLFSVGVPLNVLSKLGG